MKKLLFSLLLAVPVLLSAQTDNTGKTTVRHIRGIHAVEVDFGKSRYGFFGGLSYVQYLKKVLYIKGMLFYEKISFAPFTIGSLGMDIFPAYTIYRSPGKFYVNALLGVSFIATDILVNDDEYNENANEISKPKGGLVGGIEMEYYISGKASLIFNLSKKYYLPTNSFGQQRTFASIGLRYAL